MIGRLLRRLRGHREHPADRDTRAEIEAYLELRAAELEQQGLEPGEARRRAEAAFGDREEVVARCRRIGRRARRRRSIRELGESLIGDARFAVRILVSRPLLSVTAVLTLGLGIGASTAIFGVVEAVLLQPLPYPDPDRLVRIFESNPTTPEFPVAPGNLLDYRGLHEVFAGAAVYTRRDLQLSDPDRAQQLVAMRVSAGYFNVLGHPLHLGRALGREDEIPDTRTAVISHRLWTETFRADPDVIGERLSLGGHEFTVVGVAPRGLSHPGGSYRSVGYGEQVDVWWPLWLVPGEARRNAHNTNGIARLRDGVTLHEAREALAALSRRLEQTHPETNTGWTARIEPLREQIVGETRPLLLTLLAAVALVLVIACVNVANLLLATSGARAREIAVRAALGAAPGRLSRQLLIESGLLALVGGIVGTASAAAGLVSLVAAAPDGLARTHEIGLNPTALAFALLLTMGTGLVFGLAPAARLARQEPVAVLRGQAPATAGRHRHGGPLASLVVAEAALAGALLVGAFLLLRTFVNLAAVEPGFEPGDVLAASVSLPDALYPEVPERDAFYRELRERVLALPGVSGVGFGSDLPWDGYDENTGFGIRGWTPPGDESLGARYHFRAPGYFEALDIPILAGRELQESDGPESERVVLINEAAAERFWERGGAPGSPLGAVLDLWGEERRVVGIVGNVADGPSAGPGPPALYVPVSQWPHDPMLLVVEGAASPGDLTPALRDLLRDLDPRIPLGDVRLLEAVAEQRRGSERFAMQLGILLSLSALGLTAIGLYGIVAHDVARRRREMGIRMALGAGRAALVRRLVLRGVGLATVGLTAGMILVAYAGTGLSRVLYRVDPADPASHGAAAAVLLAVAVLAAWLPARRVARTSPREALTVE